MKRSQIFPLALGLLLGTALTPAAFSAEGGGGNPAEEESPFAFRAVSAESPTGADEPATSRGSGEEKAAFDPRDKLNQPPDFVVDWEANKIRPVGRKGWWRGGGNTAGSVPGKSAFDPGDKLNQPPDFVVDWEANKIRPVGRKGWWRGGGNSQKPGSGEIFSDAAPTSRTGKATPPGLSLFGLDADSSNGK